MPVRPAQNPPVARLQDVADHAGVTKSIASRVLNGTSVTVRDETRTRVFEAARELGYRPNMAARALNRGATGCVGLVVPDLANVVYSRIVRGAVRAAAGSGLAVLVGDDSQESEDVADLVRDGRIDGIIMLAARPGHPLVELLLASATPCVFAHRAVPGSGRNVVIDDAYASGLAVEHLHALGHRRIGHVGGPEDIDTAQRRARGFRAAASALGLSGAQAPVVHTAYTERDGVAAAARLLATAQPPTAIFTASLQQAIGVRAHAARAGLDVPRELSIVSFDDMPFLEYLQPPLTTVRVPLEELGETALRALLEQMRGEPMRDHTIATAPHVVVRESTAKAP